MIDSRKENNVGQTRLLKDRSITILRFRESEIPSMKAKYRMRDNYIISIIDTYNTDTSLI